MVLLWPLCLYSITTMNSTCSTTAVSVLFRNSRNTNKGTKSGCISSNSTSIHNNGGISYLLCRNDELINEAAVSALMRIVFVWVLTGSIWNRFFPLDSGTQRLRQVCSEIFTGCSRIRKDIMKKRKRKLYYCKNYVIHKFLFFLI